MSNIKIIHGNIFTSNCQTLVNTVNCVGVMGAGIAFEFKLRLPMMYQKYLTICNNNQLDIGKLWLYKDSSPWTLNFPTKKHWKYPSKENYLHAGLNKFIASYKQLGIESIAFPLLGASKGGIPTELSLSIMQSHLQQCDIPVEIYHYDPLADDDLFQQFKAKLLETNIDQLKAATGIRADKLNLLITALSSSKIHQMNQLIQVQGIGEASLEKAFQFVQSPTAMQSGFDF